MHRNVSESSLAAKGEIAGGAYNRATFESYKTELRRQMSKPYVQDQKLGSIMDKVYRENASIGSGSTAAAIRHELKTGQAVKGSMHSQKGIDTMRSLERWQKVSPYARPGDRAAAENVILDLQDALGY